MICTYCGRDKPGSEFSDEHVIPKAVLCGGLEPTNPFILSSVCAICNNLCGRFVDRPFLKNWFMQNGRATNSRRFLDFSRNPAIPLTFMGNLRESPLSGKVCDNWLGPTGDVIFHFHDPYPDSTQVGRPLHEPGQAYDPGFVFLFVWATNPVWHPCILKSVVGTFPEAQLYIPNAVNPPPPFQKVPPELEDLRKKVDEISRNELSVQFQMSVDYGDRFLAKLALGFGGLLLAPPFAQSEDANRLRGFLWERDSKKREQSTVRGSSFMGMPKDSVLEKYLGWPPGHIIHIMAADSVLALIATFYGTQSGLIEIAKDPALWAGKIPDEGIVYVIAPGFKSWEPATLGHYLAARAGSLPAEDELRQFLEKVENAPALPPVHVS